MVANVSKKGSFVTGEMVIGAFLTNSSLQAVFMPSYFFHICFPVAGRGVDLNRNWSVDWGMKEKVSISVVSQFSQEN